MNHQKFEASIDKILNQIQEQSSIGTLSEKTIHAVLKEYYAESEQCKEQKVGRYVADIYVDGRIIEIQTRHFHKLREKLTAFLPEYEVTVVYPIIFHKWIRWIDPFTGEISAKRRSPKTGSIYQILPELYAVKSFLTHENLTFTLVLLDVEEYRYLNGWSKDKKRGSERSDGIPQCLHMEVSIKTLADYLQFLPDNLPEIFTAKDYQHISRLSKKRTWNAMNVLQTLGIIFPCGKQGRAYLYTKDSMSCSKDTFLSKNSTFPKKR